MIKVQSRESFLHILWQFLPEDCKAAELGVLHGDFSKMILEIIKPGELTLIDPYCIGEKIYSGVLDCLPTAYSLESDWHNLNIRFNLEILSKQVRPIRKYSFDAVRDQADGYLDFVYHDASHLYEDIKKDLSEWLPKVKHDGLICGHDYIDLEGFGVKQAVNEFMAEHNFEMIIFNENGGDYALKRKQA